MRKFKNLLEARAGWVQFLATANLYSKIVNLSQWKYESKGCYSFQVKFQFSDVWVNNGVYKEGRALIYLSEKFYKDIDKLSRDILRMTPRWNNSKTIGTFFLGDLIEKYEKVKEAQ